MSASQCSSSSRCESGWTSYLIGQSSFEENQYQGFGGFADGYNFEKQQQQQQQDEDEDLSMVSDASSGPPHCAEDYCMYQLATTIKKKTKRKTKEHSRSLKLHSYFDDTASSPVSRKEAGKNNAETSMDHVLEFSQGFSSATDFKGKPSLKKHFRMLESDNSGSRRTRLFSRKKMGMTPNSD